MNNEYDYEYVQRLHDLIIPKLEAFRDNGDGAIIHYVNTIISKVKGWKSLYEINKEYSQLVTWREYIRTAETWLIKKGEEIGK